MVIWFGLITESASRIRVEDWILRDVGNDKCLLVPKKKKTLGTVQEKKRFAEWRPRTPSGPLQTPVDMDLLTFESRLEEA